MRLLLLALFSIIPRFPPCLSAARARVDSASSSPHPAYEREIRVKEALDTSVGSSTVGRQLYAWTRQQSKFIRDARKEFVGAFEYEIYNAERMRAVYLAAVVDSLYCTTQENRVELRPARNFTFLSSFDDTGVMALRHLLHNIFTAQMHLGSDANCIDEPATTEKGALSALVLLFGVLYIDRDLYGNNETKFGLAWQEVEKEVNDVLGSWQSGMRLSHSLPPSLRSRLGLGYALLRWGRLKEEEQNSKDRVLSHELLPQSYFQLEMHLCE